MGPALCVPAISAFIYFGTDAPPALAKPLYGAAKAFLLVWPLIAWFMILPQQQKQLPKSPNRKQSFIWGIVSGTMIVAAMFGLMQTPVGDLVEATEPMIREKGEQLGFLKYFLPFAIAMSLVHSALEEYFWRGFVAGRLATAMNPTLGQIISAVGFAAHHYIIVWVFFPDATWLFLFLGTCVGIGGFIWSYIYQRTGSLLGAWVSHLMVDLGIFWIAWQVLQS